MLVVGGMRTVTGAFVGTALITIGNEIARQLGDDYEIERLPELFLGASLLAVMLLAPRRAARRRRRRGRGCGGGCGAARSPAAPADDDTAAPVGGRRAQGRGHQRPLRWVPGPRRCRGAGATGRGRRADRPQRRRQDDDVQRHHRPRHRAGRAGHPRRPRPQPDPPHRIARAGLARTFQNLRLFATLPVRENVALAAVSAARYRPDAPAVEVEVLLASAGLAESPSGRRRRSTTGTSGGWSSPGPPRSPPPTSCSTSRRRG